MANIIYSAYWCNPQSQAGHGGFNWLRILLERHNLIVFTTKKSEQGLKEFYKGEFPPNLKIHSFSDDSFLARNLKIGVHFGYFRFIKNVKKFIHSKSFNIKDIDVILHKNPMSFRYPTCLHSLNAPLILGPLGGGVQVPKILKEYFKNENRINKLRKYDKLLFRLPRYKKIYRNADKILITFDYVLETLPVRYHHKTETIFNSGIQVDNDYIERKKKDHEPINILYVGRLVRYKGAELAIRAIAELQNNNIHFDIVGEGEEYNHLKYLITKLELSKKITLHGGIEMDSVDAFYKKADIFCMPTINEAGGNVFLEAMKYSLPIVFVDNGGPKYICPTAGSLRVSINEPKIMIEELAKNLDKLIASRDLRLKMGENNFNHCKKVYSWERTKNNIFKLFDPY